jgi:hypothetical protein
LPLDHPEISRINVLLIWQIVDHQQPFHTNLNSPALFPEPWRPPGGSGTFEELHGISPSIVEMNFEKNV